jgi:hypothetical protein
MGELTGLMRADEPVRPWVCRWPAVSGTQSQAAGFNLVLKPAAGEGAESRGVVIAKSA